MSTYSLALEAADANLVVATLVGELDLTNARELEERLERAAPSDALLVLDVNRVIFVDSAALHVFFKLARSRGKAAVAVAMEPGAAVSRAIEIVGLHRALRIAASVEDLRPATAD